MNESHCFGNVNSVRVMICLGLGVVIITKDVSAKLKLILADQRLYPDQRISWIGAELEGWRLDSKKEEPRGGYWDPK